VAAGWGYTMAIKADGTLWGWGMWSGGKTGVGEWPGFHYNPTPTKAGTGNDWAGALVSCGYNHTVAVKADGSLWAWGYNNWGQIGNGFVGEQYVVVPTRVGAGNDWRAAAASHNHCVALRADGGVWAWGTNDYGQPGVGEWPGFHYNPTPTRAGTDDDWAGASVSCGYNHTVAVKADGSLWTWGYNNWGQIGNGFVGEQYVVVPTRVGTGNDWRAAAASHNHCVALRVDGNVWAWGTNDYGQLGVGNTALRSSPAQVGEGSDWAAVAAGWCCTYALKGNGELWAWGLNNYYQAGIGTTENQLTPAKVGEGFRAPSK
jgi:alpha-tubulin suppressor-like RCC1 family protein